MSAVSDEIRARLHAAGAPFHANDSIAAHLQPGDVARMQGEVEQKVLSLLRSLVIDVEHDHNSHETAQRVAKMYVREVFAGRYVERPPVTDFPNAKGLDDLYAVGPAEIRSACSHHMVPIMGHAWVGVLPGERVIGLSKFNRLAGWVMTRPQIQEEATVQLADEIEAAVKPVGLIVVVRAEHLCCGWRGVRDKGSQMVTTVTRGAMRDSADARAEFYHLIAGMEF